MLSILLPSYSEDCTELVQGLFAQGKALSVPFEIIVGDDGGDLFSFRQNQQQLQQLEGVHLYRNTQNLGRAANRNKLASLAKYPFLLFIDTDAQLQSPLFLSSYLEVVHQADVIVGGTAYNDLAPEDKRLLLRYLFGKSREQRTAKQRSSRPYDSFTTFNFLVSKNCFDQIKFDQRLKEYGHEDTVFGHQLKARRFSIKHIDNALLHKGLVSADTFLNSTEKAISNLHQLQHWYPDFTTRLLEVAKKMWLLLPVLAKAETNLRRHLTGPSPSLRVFDLYKLAVYYRTKKATYTNHQG